MTEINDRDIQFQMSRECNNYCQFLFPVSFGFMEIQAQFNKALVLV